MPHWTARVTLTLGLGAAGLTTGCGDRQPSPSADTHIDHPIVGVWFLQAVGDQPVPINHTVRLDLQPNGGASYLRGTPNPRDSQRMTFRYNLDQDTIQIGGGRSGANSPLVAGSFRLHQQTLSIRSDAGAWMLTRAKFPGGEIEAARRATPPQQPLTEVSQMPDTTD